MGRLQMLDTLSAELLPERIPMSLLLGHELHKFRRLPDRSKKMVAGKQRIVREAGRSRLFQPLHSFTAVTGKGVDAGSIVSPMMTTLIMDFDLGNRLRYPCDGFLKVTPESHDQTTD